ncbi:unnamed protein product [marine sediment metagenome]|uniref:Solute-binding protein family 5 domain-containing protein n=1 Tax=marine sediment metagenome TaxID=412755 RepID=X0ZAL1_9ZZZZ
MIRAVRFTVIILFLSLSPVCLFADSETHIVFAHPSDCITLDPAKIIDTESSLVASQIFETLVFIDESLNLKPHLAQVWTISDDGKIYTFSLRKGVFFHDGSELDAQTVCLNFMRQIDPNNPYYEKEGFPTASTRLKYISSVKAIDKYTVRIMLNKPFSPFLSYLSMIENAIISHTSIRSSKDQSLFVACGTGPFVFKEWSRNKKIDLVKNAGYWQGIPAIDKLTFSVIKNNGLRFLSCGLGYVDGMSGFSPEHINYARQDQDIILYRLFGANISYLSINNVFNSRKMRYLFQNPLLQVTGVK